MTTTGTTRILRRLAFALISAAALPAHGQDIQIRIDQLKVIVAQQDAQIAQVTQDLKAIRDRHSLQVASLATLIAAGQAQQTVVNGYMPIATTMPVIFSTLSISGKNMVLTGSNLQVRNSANPAAAANGLGNLIIGFNASDGSQTRTGSHNIVIGDYHSYTSSNGFVGGQRNRLYGSYASILAGYNNEAYGEYAVIATGTSNRASNQASTILTGNGGWVSAAKALVGTGTQNVAQGSYGNAILTGTQNWMHGIQNVCATGFGNTFNQYNTRSVMASSVKLFGGANYGFYTEKNW